VTPTTAPALVRLRRQDNLQTRETSSPTATATDEIRLPEVAPPVELNEELNRAPMPRNRLRRFGSAGRLAAFHAVILALILGAVVIALVRNFTTSYQTLAADGLAAEARSFQTAADARPAGQDLRSFIISYLRQRALPAGDVTVVALTGLGRIETVGAKALSVQPIVASLLATPPASTVIRAVSVQGRPVEILASPVTGAGKTAGTFVVAANLSSYASERSRVIDLSIAEGLVALLAGVASTFLLLRRVLRTVGRVTSTAEAIGSGRLERRLGAEDRSDEVGELARTFDAMLERIETAMNAQRRLLSDVSHQLRTPLTVARGHLEVLQRTGTHDPASAETHAIVIDELDHMRSLVERLLLLGRAMEPDFLAPEIVDLRSFLTEIHDSASVLAPRRFVLGSMPDMIIEADPAKLRGALLNLVDNAIRATGPGEVVSLGARFDDSERDLALVVEDAGPGIVEDQREAVLSRFARPGARDEDGSGLGLAIAKAVAEAHGGKITIGRSRYGGACIAIVLPYGRLISTVR